MTCSIRAILNVFTFVIAIYRCFISYISRRRKMTVRVNMLNFRESYRLDQVSRLISCGRRIIKIARFALIGEVSLNRWES